MAEGWAFPTPLLGHGPAWTLATILADLIMDAPHLRTMDNTRLCVRPSWATTLADLIMGDMPLRAMDPARL